MSNDWITSIPLAGSCVWPVLSLTNGNIFSTSSARKTMIPTLITEKKLKNSFGAKTKCLCLEASSKFYFNWSNVIKIWKMIRWISMGMDKWFSNCNLIILSLSHKNILLSKSKSIKYRLLVIEEKRFCSSHGLSDLLQSWTWIKSLYFTKKFYWLLTVPSLILEATMRHIMSFM